MWAFQYYWLYYLNCTRIVAQTVGFLNLQFYAKTGKETLTLTLSQTLLLFLWSWILYSDG